MSVYSGLWKTILDVVKFDEIHDYPGSFDPPPPRTVGFALDPMGVL